jgi:hypothetical protein
MRVGLVAGRLKENLGIPLMKLLRESTLPEGGSKQPGWSYTSRAKV